MKLFTRIGSTCVFAMHVHLVFVTKYRKKVFTQQVMRELKLIFANVCRDFGGTLIECDGEQDHVHLLVSYPPKVPVSKLVNSLKGVSSRLLRNKGYASIQQALWGKNLWSPSYFAGSCGGAPISIIRQYIENQQSPQQ
ncbi:MAG: IS200/IS605 family transposase [Verrucomicrobia bacterium]|nr:IS200/IS605 family transposase [Verrucomicrobiota bacterium]MDE3048146.1 IS200/IS605 family transposase [Verrucomicrobiota bacterium]